MAIDGAYKKLTENFNMDKLPITTVTIIAFPPLGYLAFSERIFIFFVFENEVIKKRQLTSLSCSSHSTVMMFYCRSNVEFVWHEIAYTRRFNTDFLLLSFFPHSSREIEFVVVQLSTIVPIENSMNKPFIQY